MNGFLSHRCDMTNNSMDSHGCASSDVITLPMYSDESPSGQIAAPESSALLIDEKGVDA